MQKIPRSIYLDYNATTPVDPQVFSVMEPYFKTHFGNPSSFSHQWGWAAQKAVETARTQVAAFIHAKPLEVYFTAGATEGNNWVIFGLIEKLRAENPGAPIHFLTSSVEHSSVTNAMKEAARRGIEVDFLKPNSFGQVTLAAVKAAIKPHTRLMSFIWVNNEIGSINPLTELALFAKEKQIYLHTDATQAVGKVPVSVVDSPVDFMTASAHKLYGPKGVGFLYVRSSKPKVTLPAFIFGGGQEYGMRSGTLNVPAIVGLGEACAICEKSLGEEWARTTELRHYLWKSLQETFPDVKLNGHPTERSPINLNVTFPQKNIEALLPKLTRLAFSQGSACHTGTLQISPVLAEIGLTPEQAQGTLRLSLGRWTTQEELDVAIDILAAAINSGE